MPPPCARTLGRPPCSTSQSSRGAEWELSRSQKMDDRTRVRRGVRRRRERVSHPSAQLPMAPDSAPPRSTSEGVHSHGLGTRGGEI
eukprot:6729741-Pyramimonas_sp.AAC.1